MITLLVFAVALFIAVLVSELADRSILSTAVLFLFAGFLAGDGVLDLIPLQPRDPAVANLSTLALFTVLFTDGMRVSLRDLTSAWQLPGRALLLGTPLTVLGTAALFHWMGGLPWLASFLLGAILCPTDPVFAAAIVGRHEIPWRLRHLLNVESGVNDGLALPLVLVLLAFSVGTRPHLGELGLELSSGVALGIAVPWLACRIERSRFLGIAKPYQPLFAFSIGLLVLGLASLAHANLYLAAFSAGVTIATMRQELRDEFHRFGELIAELLKLGALLLFGALISPRFLAEIHWSGYLVALLLLVLVRPLALQLALFGSALDWRERLTAGWFGPKGFASAIYGLLLFQFGVADSERLFHLVALVIAASILAHSSTDVPIAAWFRRCQHRREPPSPGTATDQAARRE